MVKIAKITAAIALAVAAASASAQFYGEVAYHESVYDKHGVDRLDLGALGLTVGYDLHPNMAIEGMLAFAVGDDSVRFGGRQVTGELDYSAGLFAKPKFKVTEGFEVFARLGWARSEISASGLEASVSDDGSDFAYGLGVQFNVTKNAYVTGSYMRLYDKSDVKINGRSIGLGYRF